MSDHVKKGQKYQNREAFVAHRNIKRAVRDVDAEAALKAKACGGVCRRCAQKVVWRFKYGKYKAMRAGRAGNCTACRLKRIFLAYRVLCDPCARESKMCPGCNKPPAQAELAEGEGEPEDEEGAGEESDSEDDLAELEAAGVVITRN